MLAPALRDASPSGLLQTGDAVQIVSCRCQTGHSRYGVISSVDTRTNVFVVLLANSVYTAKFCRPLRVIPSTQAELRKHLPRPSQMAPVVREERAQWRTVLDGPLDLYRARW